MTKNKNIWILQTGEPLHIDQDDLRPMRGMNLADKLSEKGNNVTLISSLFNHQKKIHRSHKYVGKKTHINENLALILLDSPGYKKNISIRRIYDHLIMSYNLRKFLSGEKKQPDIVFIGYPPIEVAFVMYRWLKKRNISDMEMLKTFNCGVGFCIITSKKKSIKIKKFFAKNFQPYEIGYVGESKKRLIFKKKIKW